MAKSKKGSGVWALSIIPLLIAIAVPLWKTLQSNDPISFLLPNLLLFSGYREEARALWNNLVKIDTRIIRQPAHIPIINAEDYSFDALKAATDNWRHPAIVRGLFSNTPGMEKWASADYLPSKLGDFTIPVVRSAEVGKLQNDRVNMMFKEAFREIHANPESKYYLFFPVKSRFNFNGSDVGSVEVLQEKVNDIVLNDLELHRIWPGFGTKAHSTYFGSQIIVGQGSDDDDSTTGTGWHCAAGNNWFIQVVGSKRWYFMDPEHSSDMYPLRGGKVNMMTGNKNMSAVQQHLNLRYADILAGDLLYNPDWEWHTIRNYQGLSIGVPVREVNVSLSFQNNFQYTSIVYLNKILEKFNLDIGGYPPNQ